MEEQKLGSAKEVTVERTFETSRLGTQSLRASYEYVVPITCRPVSATPGHRSPDDRIGFELSENTG